MDEALPHGAEGTCKKYHELPNNQFGYCTPCDLFTIDITPTAQNFEEKVKEISELMKQRIHKFIEERRTNQKAIHTLYHNTLDIAEVYLSKNNSEEAKYWFSKAHILHILVCKETNPGICSTIAILQTILHYLICIFCKIKEDKNSILSNMFELIRFLIIIRNYIFLMNF